MKAFTPFQEMKTFLQGQKRHGVAVSILLLSFISYSSQAQPLPVSMLCGSTQVSLSCTAPDTSSLACDSPVLKFERPKQKPILVSRAASIGQHADKLPQQAVCVKGNNGESYVKVYFSNGPLECGPCLLPELYTEAGQRITRLSKNVDKEVARRGIRYGDPDERKIQFVVPTK